ncbi:MAG TPA: protein phosphatase 2C domain-containing protein [Acidimicrobiales bacterium]|nr:protein phosphatase 2C domain-containing protein [Acidimicrobiales bacterium]
MGLVGWQRRRRDALRKRPSDHQLGARTESEYATDPGPRSTNEDRAAVSAFWAVISDGAGGHAGGSVAAETAVQAVVSRLGRSPGDVEEGLVLDALAAANSAVRARRQTDDRLADMAATLSIAACTSSQPGASCWVVTNLGDSPVWHWSCDGLARLSEEHNLAAELVRSGVLPAEGSRGHPGRHTITRALGIANDVVPHVTHAVLRPGDMLVLASDGLEALAEQEIWAVVAGHEGALGTAGLLVRAALSVGATDNVTVAVLRHRVPVACG